MQFFSPYLYSMLCILLFPASFGLSFQAAILEDLIKMCTIHVYCIYIYAARYVIKIELYSTILVREQQISRLKSSLL